MMYVYYKSSVYSGSEVFPIGLFLGERVLRNSMIGGDTYSQFFGAATDKKDGWEPLQQGLFDSSYTKYEELNKRAEEYYKHNRRFYQQLVYLSGKLTKLVEIKAIG